MLDPQCVSIGSMGADIFFRFSPLWVNSHFAAGISHFTTIWRVDGFVVGALLAMAIDRRVAVRGNGARGMVWLATILGAVVAILWGIGLTDLSRLLFNLLAVGAVDVAAVLLVATVLVRPAGWSSHVHRTRRLAKLGETSCAVRLLHNTITMAAARDSRSAGATAGRGMTLAIARLSIAATLVLAVMPLWGLERRALRLKAASWVRAPEGPSPLRWRAGDDRTDDRRGP
jgi:hypothetical protein